MRISSWSYAYTLDRICSWLSWVACWQANILHRCGYSSARARLMKFSILLDTFNPGGRSQFYSILGSFGELGKCTVNPILGQHVLPMLQSYWGFIISFKVEVLQKAPPKQASKRGNFLLTVGAFLLTVKLLCLQSLEAIIRRTFPL